MAAQRGVWEMPFAGPAGEKILVAVTSCGRRLREVIVIREDLYDAELNALKELLDKLDPPRTHLRLI